MSILADDFQDKPFWWDRTPRPAGLEGDLPASADVLVIGSGYTGLHAALQTTAAGLRTVIVDAEDAGWGCSSRNGGQLSTSIKPGYAELEKAYGRFRALAILGEGSRALEWLEQFITDNKIDCDFRKTGRFHAAHNAEALEAMRRQLDAQPEELDTGAWVVEREDQHSEIGSGYYHGGVVYPRHACLDPGRYHQGLLEMALARGAEIVPHCRIDSLERKGVEFLATSGKGSITVKNVIVCTSGYTGKLTPWQRNRIIPIGSYMIATEPLEEGLTDDLFPSGRVISDSRKLVVYYRTCPENRRVLFGGRASLKETDPVKSAPLVRELMVRRFPQLESAKLTHSWMGFVGYTFDKLPHLGEQDGIYYCMGYCGSGVTLASYLGAKIGMKLIGDDEGQTALDDISFPGRFYYSGNPWFLAPSISFYRWQDERKSGGIRLRGG